MRGRGRGACEWDHDHDSDADSEHVPGPVESVAPVWHGPELGASMHDSDSEYDEPFNVARHGGFVRQSPGRAPAGVGLARGPGRPGLVPAPAQTQYPILVINYAIMPGTVTGSHGDHESESAAGPGRVAT